MITRSQRQRLGFKWAQDNFGKEEVASLPQRGLRLLEEAAETAQATGLSEELALKVVRHVFSKPVGELSQELGGLSLTMLVLAETASIDLDEAEHSELTRVLSKSKDHWQKRNKSKNDAGLVVDGLPTTPDSLNIPYLAPFIGPQYRDGAPCSHPGCLSHISHPCEGCGRIAGRFPDETF